MTKKHKIKTEIDVFIDEEKLIRIEKITDYLFIKTHEQVPVDTIIASLQALQLRNPKAKVWIYEHQDSVLCLESRHNTSRKLTPDEIEVVRKNQEIQKIENQKREARASINMSLLAKIRAKGAPVIEFESDSIDA